MSGFLLNGTRVSPSYRYDDTVTGADQLRPPSSLWATKIPLLASNPYALYCPPVESTPLGSAVVGCIPRNVIAMNVAYNRPRSSNFTIGVEAALSKPAGSGIDDRVHVRPPSPDAETPIPAYPPPTSE